MASEKSNEIVYNFCKYLEKSDNRKLIEGYSIEELKKAKYEYSQDSYKDFYKAIVDRIKELKELEHVKTQGVTAKEKWLDRFFGFITGIVITLLIIYLKGCLRHGVK